MWQQRHLSLTLCVYLGLCGVVCVVLRVALLDDWCRGDYAALLLARVGLVRLGLSHRISGVLDVQRYGYAVGQGALAIVCRCEYDCATATSRRVHV
jgi:porphobilinogen deaminase